MVLPRSCAAVLALSIAAPVAAQAPGAAPEPRWSPVEQAAPGDVYWWDNQGDTFVGARWVEGEGRHEIYRSEDAGATPVLIGADLPGVRANLIKLEGDVLAVVLDSMTFNQTARFSRDGGQTWFGGELPLGAFATDFAVQNDTLVFSADGDTPVLWSADDGETWDVADGPECLTRSLFQSQGALHVITVCDTYRATSVADGWASYPMDGVWGAWDSAVSDDAVYLAHSFTSSSQADLYRQDVGGAWERLEIYDALGFTGEVGINSPEINTLEVDGDVVLVELIGLGLALSEDRGDTWRFINEGLPQLSDGGYGLSKTLIGEDALHVRAWTGATDEPQSYRFPLTPNRAVQNEGGADAPVALRVGPNPAHATLTVRSGAAEAEVELTDLLGRTVRTGTGATVQLDVSSLAPGPYVVRVTTEGKPTVRRVTVLR